MEHTSNEHPLPYKPDEEVTNQVVSIFEEMGQEVHPLECPMVKSLTYIALLNMEYEHQDIVPYWRKHGVITLTNDELHLFGHLFFRLAYAVGKATGVVTATAEHAILGALVKDGVIGDDDVALILTGDLENERGEHLMELVTKKAEEMGFSVYGQDDEDQD
jgi:hypothetical protein